MKRLMRFPVVFLVVMLFFATAQAATWSSSDKWGTWTNNGYTVRNDVWGSGAGPQSIWANSYSNWGVQANHPNTGGVKSYPHSAKNINKRISALNTLKSSFDVTVPSGGAWSAAYDIWNVGHSYEIMLWMNYTGTANGNGNVKPISYNYDASGSAVPVYTNLSIGDHKWNVFRGSNGSNSVYSFLRTSKTNTGTVNILAIMQWLKNKGWFSDVTVEEVQFGFEITSTGGSKAFTCKSYSVTGN